jgi:ribosome-associated protein
MTLDGRDLAFALAKVAYEKDAERINVLELPSGFSSRFAVLCDGRSERQAYAIAEEVWHLAKREKIPHNGVEGEAGWFLVDCGDTVFHSFQTELRDRYALDHIWKNALRLDWVERLALPAEARVSQGEPEILKPARVPDELPPAMAIRLGRRGR